MLTCWRASPPIWRSPRWWTATTECTWRSPRQFLPRSDEGWDLSQRPQRHSTEEMDHVRDRQDRGVRNFSLARFGRTTGEILRSLRKSYRRAKSAPPRPQNDDFAKECKSRSTFAHSIWLLLPSAAIAVVLTLAALSAQSASPQTVT